MSTKFPTIIKDLIESGMTQSDIAQACSITQPYVSDLLTGRRNCPNWVIGEALVNLHKQVKSNQIDQRALSKAGNNNE